MLSVVSFLPRPTNQARFPKNLFISFTGPNKKTSKEVFFFSCLWSINHADGYRMANAGPVLVARQGELIGDEDTKATVHIFSSSGILIITGSSSDRHTRS